jgi:hypothetical protein
VGLLLNVCIKPMLAPAIRKSDQSACDQIRHHSKHHSDLLISKYNVRYWINLGDNSDRVEIRFRKVSLIKWRDERIREILAVVLALKTMPYISHLSGRQRSRILLDTCTPHLINPRPGPLAAPEATQGPLTEFHLFLEWVCSISLPLPHAYSLNTQPLGWGGR